MNQTSKNDNPPNAPNPLQDPAARAALRQVTPRILVVDDEPDLRELLELTLVRMGLDVDMAPSVAAAREQMAARDYALCLTDMRLQDGLGLEVVAAATQRQPPIPIAVITAYGNAENAVAALKAGAFDYVSKPVELEAIRELVKGALKLTPVRSGGREQPALAAPIAQGLAGISPAIQEVRQTIARLARSIAPVAITGESGSGKELAARLIHETSVRKDHAFIAVNCGAIPENLMEAEFFGYRKGAFTGADADRMGFFQAAQGGTLFLDEVADLPLTMQVKLLRAIQERKVRRVGATQEELADVRIISATHKDLAACVQAGTFRQDLFYRLNVISLRMPALRERVEDIPALALELLAKIVKRNGAEHNPGLSETALSQLARYAFPGNVRELENILERALAFSVDDQGPLDIPLEPSEALMEAQALDATAGASDMQPMTLAAEAAERVVGDLPNDLSAYLDAVEKEILLRALAQTHDNRTAAAKLLGISFRQMRYRLQRLGIQ
jgi:two-component system response regulator PilR (NtrC family)